MRVAFLAVLLVGCPWVGPEKYEERVQDADGDGVVGDRFDGEDCLDGNAGVDRCDADGDGENSLAAGGDDCDDTDPTIHPGAQEICDGIDQDCNQLIDDEAFDRIPVFTDADGDGHGITPDGLACFSDPPPLGLSFLDDDCDDGTDVVFPGADEFCDGIDRDCDGDGNDPNSLDAATLFADGDLDGYGSGLSVGAGCPSEGFAQGADDCDDSDGTIFPGAPEIAYDGIDQACDGPGNEWDVDGDGVEARAPGNDCDDTNPNVFPGAEEHCDSVDTDCDLLSDSADPNVDIAEKTPVYVDSDGDGFGDQAGVTYFCPAEVPVGAQLIGEDCDDSDPTIHPDAAEIHYELSGIDQDCDGGANEWDADGDGSPNLGSPADCDDGNAGIFPGAPEACDGIDSDCDGLADEDDNDIDPLLFIRRFPDLDGDGYGDSLLGQDFCPGNAPIDWVELGTDCDDSEAGISPLADEVCADGIDNDCDGAVDQDAIDGVTLYRDNDGDGRGTAAFPLNACIGEAGTSPFNDDCDDGDPTIYPGAFEICGDGIAQDCDEPGNATDCDQDGEEDTAFGGTDCDDDNATINSAGSEICDALDNDCDGLVDSDDPSVDPGSLTDFFDDLDADGAGGAPSATNTCTPPPGTVANSDDCDDTDGNIFPGAIEQCNGEDDNCDGNTDEEPVLVPITWYIDRDGDGAGDPTGAFSQGCFPPTTAAYVLNADDCNDFDVMVQTPTWFRDSDADNFGQASDILVQCAQPVGYAAVAGDCVDTDPNINPGEMEACDGFDNDCDGLVDGADDTVAGETTWYQDLDNDTFGNPMVSVDACTAPPQHSATAGDCDDLNAGIRPGALEICDGEDNDCDTLVDGVDPGLSSAPFWYPDSDNDGFGDSSLPLAGCTQPQGFVGNAGDCDDTNATVSPLGVEVCGGADEDCDGLVDDADPDVTSTGQWFLDSDNDGYGDPTLGSPGCTQPTMMHVLNNEDCLDSDGAVNPLGIETCNGVDDDCDGAVDNGATNTVLWYVDQDSDGYGDPFDLTPVAACSAPAGRADNNLDCEDSFPSINPSSPVEFCNGLDDNCDGLIDDAQMAPVPLVNALDWYLDGDLDGFYGTEVQACLSPGAGYVAGNFFLDDCDDGNGAVHPGAFEVCNGADDNCDGANDEPQHVEQVAAGGAVQFFEDQDVDGFGGPSRYMCATNPEAGFISTSGDCDDFDGTVNPGAAEVCDGFDNDCDGDSDDADPSLDLNSATDFFADLDGDGHADLLDTTPVQRCQPQANESAIHDDCDDMASFVFPGATELCDFVDNDCDGFADDADTDNNFGKPFRFDDSDGDGFGDPTITGRFCVTPPGFSDTADDCDPLEGLTHPGSAVIGSTGSFTTVANAEAACGTLNTAHFTPGTHTNVAFSISGSESLEVFGTDPFNPPTLRNPAGASIFEVIGPDADLKVTDVLLSLVATAPVAPGTGLFSNGGSSEFTNVRIFGNTAVAPVGAGCAVDLQANANLDWIGGGVFGCGNTAFVSNDSYSQLYDLTFDGNGAGDSGNVSNFDIDLGNLYLTDVTVSNGGSTFTSIRMVDAYGDFEGLHAVGLAPVELSSVQSMAFNIRHSRFYDGKSICLVTAGANLQAQISNTVFGNCPLGYQVKSTTAMVMHSTFAGNDVPYDIAITGNINAFDSNYLVDNTTPCGTGMPNSMPDTANTNKSNDCSFPGWPTGNDLLTLPPLLMGYHPSTPTAASWNLYPATTETGFIALDVGVSGGSEGEPDLAGDLNFNSVPDGWERWWYGDTSLSGTGNDADGLDDSQEYVAGTSPFHADSDGDGTLDGAETAGCEMDPGC